MVETDVGCYVVDFGYENKEKGRMLLESLHDLQTLADFCRLFGGGDLLQALGEEQIKKIAVMKSL